MTKKIALITGATSGIGKATAELLAQKGYHLILCGRRLERLKKIHQNLSRQTTATYLNFDIQSADEVKKAIESLPKKWKSIDILINNAGNAHGLDFIHEGNLNDWNAMIDTNIKGVLYISKLIIPEMIRRKKGHIIIIGSIAGKEVYTKGNVYCATKHAIDALTKGIRMDLNPYGIKVTAIHPGLVETEFSIVRFKGDAKKANEVYKGYQPLHPKDIANTILYTLETPPHVVISDLTILPLAQAAATIVNKKV